MLTGLRGVDLGVRDVAAAARFFIDVWRLAPVAERTGSGRSYFLGKLLREVVLREASLAEPL
jgi:type VI protein secretion system component VasK